MEPAAGYSTITSKKSISRLVSTFPQHETDADDTGEALFSWSALDHLDPTQGYAEPGDTGVSQEAAWDFLVRLSQ